MAEMIHHDISGTAFVVNYSRSKRVEISKDIYAKLWVTPESIELWNELAKNVYPNDDLNLSLRNRFYLEHMDRFAKLHDDPVIVILASGFTNFPFLTKKECTTVEVDLPNIIDFKKQQVGQWIREHKLPDRKVKYLSIDLTDKGQQSRMKDILVKEIGDRPSFVTMEGLTYYLDHKVMDELFGICREVQQPGSWTGFEYWKPDTMSYPVMVKLMDYLGRKFGYTDQKWFLFDEEYIRGIKDYREIEATDIAALELKYSETRIFQGRDNKIPVYFSLLERV